MMLMDFSIAHTQVIMMLMDFVLEEVLGSGLQLKGTDADAKPPLAAIVGFMRQVIVSGPSQTNISDPRVLYK